MHRRMAVCAPLRALIHFRDWHREAGHGVLMALVEGIKCPEQLPPKAFQDGKSTSSPAVYT